MGGQGFGVTAKWCDRHGFFIMFLGGRMVEVGDGDADGRLRGIELRMRKTEEGKTWGGMRAEGRMGVPGWG